MPSHNTYLLIDAGNSAIKWAVTHNLSLNHVYAALRHPAQRDHLFVEKGRFTDTLYTNAPYSPLYSPNTQLPTEPNWKGLPQPHSVWISNVAGETVSQRLDEWIRAYWPTVPQHRIRAQPQQCGITNHYDQPQQLGSDRWASLIGAHAAYPGEALCIVTLGTATTLEALDANGQFLGGLIAPGITSALHALHQHTAQLPDPNTFPMLPPSSSKTQMPLSPPFFATNTITALQEGQKLMQAGFIERGWQSVCTHFNAMPSRVSKDAAVRCILSGGAALDIAPHLHIPYTYHPNLVLQGLSVIAYTQVDTST